VGTQRYVLGKLGQLFLTLLLILTMAFFLFRVWQPGDPVQTWARSQGARYTPEQLDAIKAEWIAQRPLNRLYWAAETDLTPAMASGEVWLAYAWQGAYAQLLAKGTPVAYANPKEGRNSWVGVYGIRKGTKDLDLALKFLDAKLGQATGNNVVTMFYYGHSNQEVMQHITDATLKKAFSIDDPSILSKTNFTPNLTAEQRDAWTAMWAEVKAAP